MMLYSVFIVIFFAISVFGGSLCPPRVDIYPCTCANIRFGKKVQTLITCQGLGDSDSLNAIVPSLRSIEIDQFYLYDSFWKAQLLGSAGESQKVLPADWITLLNIKEIEIVDTTLSSCFACQWKINCRNSVTISFKVTNSSSSDRICTLCDYGRGNKNPWTACMSKLKEFHFNYGKLTSFGVDLFPLAMREMIILNLSYNQIVKVDSNALKNLPNLKTLDLSHNAIEHFDHMFVGQEVQLEHLDVSWNFIKTLGADLFSSVQHLKTLQVSNNVIADLKLNEWEKAPSSLKHIDLSNNLLNCDCNIKWINSTFAVGVAIRGKCSAPPEYQDTPVRRASRFLIERCDSLGKIGTRKPSSTTPSPRTARRRNN